MRTARVVVALASWCVFLVACDGVSLPSDPNDLPRIVSQVRALVDGHRPELAPAITYLKENEERFQATESDPLAKVVPGTVVDDLHELSGCWGAVGQAEPDCPGIRLYFAFRFDRQGQTYTQWVLQRDALDLVPVQLTESGRYVVQDQSRVALFAERLWITDPFTGENLEEPVDPRLQPTEYLATLAAERLLLYRGKQELAEAPKDNHLWIWRRFECPP